MIPRDEAKDIRECYGVWICNSGLPVVRGRTVVVTPKKFNRAFFYKWVKQMKMERIEPIPPQCVPEHDEPTDWKAEAVRRYPRVTEWD